MSFISNKKNRLFLGILPAFFLLISSYTLNAQEEFEDSIIFDEIQIDTVTESEYSPANESQYFLQKPYNQQDEPFIKRNLSDSYVNDLQNDNEFWYANNAIEKIEPKPSFWEKLLVTAWHSSFVWFIIIVAFIILIVWFLVTSEIRIFRSSSSVIKEGDAAEEQTDNIFQMNFAKEIAKATADGNFRMVIRLLFLQSLKVMADRNFIQYGIDRTNYEYLGQLRNTSYYRDFFNLTRSYEFVWYGKFDLPENQYLELRAEFESFTKKLASF